MEGVAIGDGGNPDGLVTAGNSECVGDFRKLFHPVSTLLCFIIPAAISAVELFECFPEV